KHRMLHSQQTMPVLPADDDLSDELAPPAPVPGSGTVLALFTPDLTDTSTIKRVRGFLEHGMAVVVFGLRRSRYNTASRPSWPHVELGRTTDRHYGHRLVALLRCLRLLLAERAQLRRAALLYARNLDQLLLVLLVRRLFRRDAAIVYEVLDI